MQNLYLLKHKCKLKYNSKITYLMDLHLGMLILLILIQITMSSNYSVPFILINFIFIILFYLFLFFYLLLFIYIIMNHLT